MSNPWGSICTRRRKLRDAAIALLKGRTQAGDKVYSPRDFPTNDGDLPALRLKVVRSSSENLVGNAGPSQFNTTDTLEVLIRCDATASLDDEGAADAEERVDAIAEQVERLIVNAPELQLLGVDEFKAIRRAFGYDGSAALHLGEAMLEFDYVYLQPADDFARPDDAPLTQVAVTGTATPYATPDAPFIIDTTGD